MRRLFDRTLKPVCVSARSVTIRWLERRNGIHTEVEIELEDLGVDAPGRVRYKPAAWFIMRRILPPRKVASDDVFIDMGSGMGRAVFQAARSYPFRRVIGVEISNELNRAARANIDRSRGRLRCREVLLVSADILDYEFPDDVTVVFFNNPLVGELFAAAAEKVLASVDRRPRRVRVIYCNPIEHEMLMRTGRFRPVRRLRGLRPSAEWSRSNSTRMYEVSARVAETPHPKAG